MKDIIKSLLTAHKPEQVRASQRGHNENWKNKLSLRASRE